MYFLENSFLYIIRVPHITVATDVICGFPTETEEVLNITSTQPKSNLFINESIHVQS